MTADDRKALGPDGVALAEALGAREPSLHETYVDGRKRGTLREADAWFDSVPESGECAQPCPVDALTSRIKAGSMPLWERHELAILDELRQTRAERDAARQELAAARAAIGEAWFLRPDDSLALALSRKTTALERLCAEGGGK